MSSVLIEKIDKGLSDYYKQRKTHYSDDGEGKFIAFCNDNGFEDDGDIEDELKEEDANDCTLTDFDDNFPFDSIMKNDNERIETIFEVLKHIAKYGAYAAPPKIKKQKSRPYKPKNVTLHIDMCEVVTGNDKDRVMHKYAQMECLKPHLKKDNNLKHFFAVGEKYQYPFLTYMVDSYTRDKARNYKITKKPLSPSEWANENTFMKKLSRNHPK
eukprot:UN03512